MSNNRKIYTVTELMSDERFQNYCMQCNSADEEYWKSVILQNWNQRDTFEQAYKAVKELSNEINFNSTRQDVKVIKLKKDRRSLNRNLFIKLLSTAAVFFILCFVLFNLPEKPQYLKITSGLGETKKVILPDSSQITLNSNSILVYEEFMHKSREVQLVGEGFFEIDTKPDMSPFIVKTQHGDILVTGTVFNVRSRSGLFESTLLEGGITFEREGKNDIILSPGDHLNISNNSLKITSEEVDSKIAWKEGRLFFKSASILEIAKRLKDDFGLSVNVENDKLKHKKINANIATRNPMVLLESIAAIYEFRIVKVTKDKVILK